MAYDGEFREESPAGGREASRSVRVNSNYTSTGREIESGTQGSMNVGEEFLGSRFRGFQIEFHY